LFVDGNIRGGGSGLRAARRLRVGRRTKGQTQTQEKQVWAFFHGGNQSIACPGGFRGSIVKEACFLSKS
jgi:hypothetical protein